MQICKFGCGKQATHFDRCHRKPLKCPAVRAKRFQPREGSRVNDSCAYGCGKPARYGTRKPRCSPHFRQCPEFYASWKAASSIVTDELCKNGCGRVGVRRVSNGVLCAIHPNQCPVVVERNRAHLLRHSKKGAQARKEKADREMVHRLKKGVRRTFDSRDLVKRGLKKRECEGCGREKWTSKITGPEVVDIPLDVDHINGDRDDNRLENLRLLCKNCHGLTPTYGWRGAAAKRLSDSVGVPSVLVG